MADDRRFREVNDYARCHGYFAGFPNFHQADYGDGVVYGSILLSDTEAEFRDVPRSTYGVYHIEDVPGLFRGAADYAAQSGFPAAFPNCHQADHGAGVVYGTMLIKAGVAEGRDVRRSELGSPRIDDVPTMMRAANDYAVRNGFAAGFPTFHQADHGHGVVYGMVLFEPLTTRARDVPADLLRLYQDPPQRWAIILCNLSDRPPGAGSDQRYRDFFLEQGAGSGGAYDYWRDVSYCIGGLRGSEVFGWLDVGHTTPELLTSVSTAQRNQAFRWGLDAVQANHLDLSGFAHKVMLFNGGGNDHGQANGGVLFMYADTTPLEPTFMVHEMGHEFGLDHSFGEQPTSCASGDPRPGAYCDMYDVMSAMNVHHFMDAQNRRSGPSLNAMSRARLNWLHRSRIWSSTVDPLGETVVLAPLDRQDLDGYLMAKFSAPSRDATQPVDSTYTLELKEPVGWDRSFVSDHAYLHEIRSDGLVRLLTNFNIGLLDLEPTGEFVAPKSSVVVRLVGIDSAAHRATLRIWRLPANGRRDVRIHYINFNPPGDDVAGEYVVIQNDSSGAVTLTGWTLRDLAHHVFTFPSFALESGFHVNVWTKPGVADSENLFAGRRAAIWNNTGDTAILRDTSGREVAKYAY